MIKIFLIVFSLTGQGTMQMRGDLEMATMDECVARAVYINDSKEPLNAACYVVTEVATFE